MKQNSLYLLLLILLASCQANDDAEVITSLDEVNVQILTPLNLENVFPGDALIFKAIVSTEASSTLTNLKAKWISDKDGLLFEENINADGETLFTTSTLSKNIHQIRLDIINEVDSIISDSVEIYNAIKLFPIEKTNNASTIKWCTIEDSNFQSFKLYRSRFKNNILQNEPIYVSNNIQDTTYVDTTAILGEKHYYKVIVERSSQLPDKFESNIDSIQTGNFKKLNYPILKLIPDFSRNYAYGIVNTESIYEDNETGYGLIFINLDEFSIENRILQNIRFSDLDIDPSGNYLYLASRSNIIHKVNLNTKTLESTLSLFYSAHKIEVGNNGKLYCHITPPTSGSTEFRIYDLETSSNIPYSSDTYVGYSHGDFEIDQNNTIYHGESNSSGSRLSKIGTSNNSFSLLNQWNSNNYQRPRIVLNNSKLFWNHYMLDLDFNILGTFQNSYGNIDIQDVSPNGNRVLGWQNIYNTNNQSIIKEIPAYLDSGIFINDNTVLIYKNYNPLYQQYESKIYIYEFN